MAAFRPPSIWRHLVQNRPEFDHFISGHGPLGGIGGATRRRTTPQRRPDDNVLAKRLRGLRSQFARLRPPQNQRDVNALGRLLDRQNLGDVPGVSDYLRDVGSYFRRGGKVTGTVRPFSPWQFAREIGNFTRLPSAQEVPAQEVPAQVTEPVQLQRQRGRPIGSFGGVATPSGPLWNSRAFEAIFNTVRTTGNPDVWKNVLRRGGAGNVEIGYSGLNEWFQSPENINRDIPKNEILEIVGRGQLIPTEVFRGAPDRVSGTTGSNILRPRGEAKHARWKNFPGGSDAREIFLRFQPWDRPAVVSFEGAGLAAPPLLRQDFGVEFPGRHGDPFNTITRLRTWDFLSGPESSIGGGHDIIHMGENQSDWEKVGRERGWRPPLTPEIQVKMNRYMQGTHVDRNEARHLGPSSSSDMDQREWEELRSELEPYLSRDRVPNLPYKDDMEWAKLGMRRMLRYAADNGYDFLTWPTGEQVARSYRLDGVIKAIANVERASDGSGWLIRTKFVPDELSGPGNIESRGLSRELKIKDNELNDVLGDDIAERIRGDRPLLVLNHRSPYLVDTEVNNEMIRIAREAMSHQQVSYNDLHVLISNDIGVYEALMRAYPTLEDNENWTENVIESVFSVRDTGYSDLDIRYEAKWTRELYDKAHTNYFRKLAEEYGVEVQEIDLDTGKWGIFDEEGRRITAEGVVSHLSFVFDSRDAALLWTAKEDLTLDMIKRTGATPGRVTVGPIIERVFGIPIVEGMKIPQNTRT